MTGIFPVGLSASQLDGGLNGITGSTSNAIFFSLAATIALRVCTEIGTP